MATITFDTLKFVETLTSHGMPESQAKGVAEAFKGVAGETETATKRDLAETELRLRHEMERIRHEMELVRLEVRDAEQRMLIKLGSLLVVAVGVVATLVKLL